MIEELIGLYQCKRKKSLPEPTDSCDLINKISIVLNEMKISTIRILEKI